MHEDEHLLDLASHLTELIAETFVTARMIDSTMFRLLLFLFSERLTKYVFHKFYLRAVDGRE